MSIILKFSRIFLNRNYFRSAGNGAVSGGDRGQVSDNSCKSSGNDGDDDDDDNNDDGKVKGKDDGGQIGSKNAFCCYSSCVSWIQ